MPSPSLSDYYRFCPGEEAIKLSNAVCRGRRRTHFPKCRGCPFNDDERQPASVAPGESPPVAKAGNAASRAGSNRREPPPPASRDLSDLFRSTDIRGLVPLPMTSDAAWRVGFSTAQYLHSKLKGFDRATPRARCMVTASDARSASAAIHAAMTNGVRAAGLTVLDIGVVDTPQLHFAVRHLQACGGIVTTGGRSPVAYSGFKICGAGGRDLSATTGLIDIRDIACRIPSHHTGEIAARQEFDLSDAYRDFLRGFLHDVGAQRPLRIVVDASNGVAGRGVRTLFDGLTGIELLILNDTPDEPFVHEPDPADSANLSALRRGVRQHKADLGACFDGDGDAVTFVDERGGAIWPETMAVLIGRLCVERVGGGVVVLDRRFGPLALEPLEQGGAVIHRATGASNHMRKSMAESGGVFGATLSGQFFFAHAGGGESALLALAAAVQIGRTGRRTWSDLARPIQPHRLLVQHRFVANEAEVTLDELGRRDGPTAQRCGDGILWRDDGGWTMLCPGDEPREWHVRAAAATQADLRQRIAHVRRLVELR